MNANEILWLIFGTAAGYLLGTLATVWIMRQRLRRDMHPAQYVIKAPTTTTALAPEYLTADWDAAVKTELAPAVITPKRRYGPAPATTMTRCAFCGKEYKRVSQHIRLTHPAQYLAPTKPRKRAEKRANHG